MDVQTAFNGELMASDWSLDGTDLASDQGLATAIFISLFTDARAKPDDALPDGETDRRGWWGDVVAPAQAPAGRPWMTGSRLWLLKREKQTPETARRAADYAREALAWVTKIGAAASLEVTAAWEGVGLLRLTVAVRRPDGTAEKFPMMWRKA